MRCPCGTGADLAGCCGRYHAGTAAPTAEALMRSRYSAFVLGEVGYLLRTWHPDTRPPSLTLDPARRWTGLEIVATTGGGPLHATGTVEFRAHYRAGGVRARQHERSRFRRDAGRWAYLDGTTG